MLKSELTPDPIRDSPNGEHQSPAPYIIIPARAFGDTRFNQYPQTFRCLALCSAHASARAGIFFCNQLLLAKVMGSSQQAISLHMTKLVKYGYLERLRKADPRRAYGSQGAKWRVIYDPRMNLEQAIANSDGIDDIEVMQTLEKITPKLPEAIEKPIKGNLSPKQIELAEKIANRYLKDEREYFSYDRIVEDLKIYLSGNQTTEAWNRLGNGLTSPIDKGYLKPNSHNNKPKEYKSQLVNGNTENKPQLVSNSMNNKSQLVSVNKVELVHNNNILTSNSNIDEIDIKKLCQIYSQIIQNHYGRPWSYDLRQTALAEDLLKAGCSISSFKDDAEGVVSWHKKNNKPAPQSLQWFISRKLNKDKPMDSKDIVKQMVSKMKF